MYSVSKNSLPPLQANLSGFSSLTISELKKEWMFGGTMFYKIKEEPPLPGGLCYFW
jgi:hypothetical protein